MAQTSGIGQHDAWGWPCPYCRGQNPLDATACAHCGAQLRDPDDDDLFTTVAADNAEIVPPEAPFGRDNMWTTDAVAEGLIDEADVIGEGEVVDEEPWIPAPAGGPVGSRGAFSAEPPRRGGDVIDEAFHLEDAASLGGQPFRGQSNGGGPHAAAPLFSSSGPAPADELQERWAGRNPFASPAAPPTAPPPGAPNPIGSSYGPPQAPSGPSPFGTPPGADPFGRPAGAPPGYREPAPEPHYDPRHEQYYEPPAPSPRPSAPPPEWGTQPDRRTQSDHGTQPDRGQQPVPDPHGLSAAVARLRPEDQEQASVPISVCGALLQPDEVVLAAVTGQMLGHAAVVVLTTRRVLIVNGRRWQPIVDVFDVGPDLVVRGRHDRDVAALSFADATRLSTVDAITEVGLAVELAERIRGEGP